MLQFLIPLLFFVPVLEPGISLKCHIVDVYDGDTVTADIVIRVRVRLLDCWAPEVRTKDKAEKKLGLKSKKNLHKLAYDKDGILFVPTGDIKHLGEITSLSRILGNIYVDGKSLSALQVESKNATFTKDRKPRK